MDLPRSRVGSGFLLVGLAFAIACSRRDASSTVDSGADTATRAATSTTLNDWSTDLGRVLLVPSDSENTAIVLLPQGSPSQLKSSTAVTLVSANGDTAVARIDSIVADSVECGDAPLVRLSGRVPSEWTVGLSARSAVSLRRDSIAALPPADSARLAADLARLASAVPMPKASRFIGLPFAVLDAFRFESGGREIVAAQLVRRLNQEASPLEERTFIIAERATAAKSQPYTVTYSQRSEGSEDAAEHFELLAATRAHESTLLLLSKDQVSKATYDLLESTETGWRVRWSRTLSC